MPPVQVIAQSVVQAGNPLIPVQGNFLASMHTSGAGPVSGEVGAFSGPFLVEEQDLTIDYLRVPLGRHNGDDITLSSCVMNHVVQSTAVAVRVTANYTRRKDDAYYALSSFQQPQKFELLSVSSDASGNSYGLSGDFGHASGTMGPQGQIRTIQPWIRRRPWDQGGTGTDSEVTRHISNTFNLGTYRVQPFASSIVIQNSTNYWDTFEAYYINPDRAGTPLSIYNEYAHERDLYLMKPGPYNYEQDQLLDVPDLINTVATAITAKNLYKDIAEEDPSPNSVYSQRLLHNEGFTEYGSFRHDYS